MKFPKLKFILIALSLCCSATLAAEHQDLQAIGDEIKPESLSQYKDHDILTFKVVRGRLPISQASIDPKARLRNFTVTIMDIRDIPSIFPLGSCSFGGKILNGISSNDLNDLYFQEYIEKITIKNSVGDLKKVEPNVLGYIDAKSIVKLEK